MDPPDSATPVFSDHGACRASRSLATLFLVAGIAQLASVIFALRHTPLSIGFQHLNSSPWAMSALADFFVGAAFASLYLFLLDTPSKTSLIFSRVAAVLTPVLGNWVLLFFMAFRLAYSPSITAALLPATQQNANGSPQPVRRAATTVVSYVFALLLLGFAAVCVWASASESLSTGAHHVATHIWPAVTFADNLAGLLFATCFAVVRERRPIMRIVLWVVAFLLTGNAATCVYVLLVARKALNDDVEFASLLLSVRNPYW